MALSVFNHMYPKTKSQINKTEIKMFDFSFGCRTLSALIKGSTVGRTIIDLLQTRLVPNGSQL